MELEIFLQKNQKFYSKIPESITQNKFLNLMIEQLPKNYNFEIHKTIWRIENLKKDLEKTDLLIILQLPQGLQMFASRLTDIITHFTNSEVYVIADENYGACCIEDTAGYLLDADFIVHYGHSCLVPIPETRLKAMYVFVDIMFDVEHLFNTIQYNFPDKQKHFYLMGVIQFNSALYILRDMLKNAGYSNLEIPQERPRCGGEVLGCTSPVLEFSDIKNTIIFLADGKFHMEGAMIANPRHTYFKYHPYEQEFIKEEYDFDRMIVNRKQQINIIPQKNQIQVGIIRGLLGRQGNPKIVQRIQQRLDKMNVQYSIILISEIFPDQLEMFKELFKKLLVLDYLQIGGQISINLYQIHMNFFVGQMKISLKIVIQKDYKNDFYSYQGGEWSNYYGKKTKKKTKKKIKLGIKSQLI